MNRTTPQATYLDRWSVELQFPFDAQLVQNLKDHISPAYREWDPDRKVWTVRAPDSAWADLAVQLLCERFPYATVAEPRSNRRSTNPDRDFETLHLLPSAPPALVRAARKVLSLEMHPDRGGSHEAMVALNLAYERLEERGCA